MSVLQILQDISEKSGSNWNDQSMLEIMGEYIDNQKNDDAFTDFVQARAAEEEVVAAEARDLDTRCNVCQVEDHDMCANNPNCSCCCDTMARIKEGS